METENDRIQILLRNARQILNIVTATFPSFQAAGPSQHCEELSNSIDELACQWRHIIQTMPDPGNEYQDVETWQSCIEKVKFSLTQFLYMTNNYQWLKQVQELMSSTASNYDIPKLVTGQTVTIIALFLGLGAAGPTLAMYFKTCSPLLIITLLYGIMMFASSYVEEEQHFWYWTSTAWLTMLWIKWFAP